MKDHSLCSSNQLECAATIMRIFFKLFSSSLLTLLCAGAAYSSEPPQLKTASTHPIQYYLSLPDGWNASQKWPVVIVIESADRLFEQANNAFVQARGTKPFILVTPLVVTNGGAGYRSVPTYHYSDPVWDRIQNLGAFKFDWEGMAAIMQDLVKEYGAEDKFFITGLEAGGHTVWATLFNHPDAVQGAALVCPNYAGRWIDENRISQTLWRKDLPIRNLVGTKDALCVAGHPIYLQMEKAMSVAVAHGYENVRILRIEGKGHDRMAGEVLDYFSSLLK